MSSPLTAPSAVFDLFGELPTGTTVLEASAGTGKTFTIAALAVRYVAEGVAELSELLLVTFGRAATSELRDRVRERLVSAERALRRPDARDSVDELVRHLADVDDDELAARRRRLTTALSGFDAATIATTHGFCQQMLSSLGASADVDPDAVLVPDIDDLLDEVVDDVYLQRYAAEPAPMLTVNDARRVARAAVGDPQAGLEPTRAPAGSLPGHRFAFARQVVAEVEHRKRARRLLDYDDLLVLLRDALVDPQTGSAAAQRVRDRYQVVLVDEFQDTDPVQWQILRAAFHGHRTLVLIGDPKQAIYAFRGGDVVTYLAARRDADATATLDRSWRSDEPLLQALDHLMGGAALGDPAIVVHGVRAAREGRELDGGAPLRLRQVTREPFGLKGSRTPPVGDVRLLIAADVAADVVRQLEQTRLLDRGTWRALRPGDIAVLAQRNADAGTVRAALVEAGVPAVVSGLSSVFGSAAAKDWLTLLTALEQPGHSGRAAAVALTPFVGWDAARLASASAAERDELSDRVRGWAQVLTGRGVAALLEAATAEGLAERLMATSSGERRLTDLRHVGQSLHLAVVQDQFGVAALTDWLRRRVADAGEDYAEDRSRRLETDAEAVQVVTVHASKGLEFPVVYVPFGWDRFEPATPDTLRFHDDLGQRLLHLGGSDDADYDAARERHFAEARGEDLRLLYVALTRARSQVVAWWAPSRNSASGPLGRMLLGDWSAGQQPPPRVSVPVDATVTASLARFAERVGDLVAVEQVDVRPTLRRWSAPAARPPDLSVGTLRRRLDVTWRRTSYSGLTAAAHELARPDVSSEPEVTGVQDEVDVPPAEAAAAVAPSGETGHLVPLMAALPGGAAFGTLVHEVLERVDPMAADLDAELLSRCQEAGTSRVPGVDPEELARSLAPVLATPLGDLAAGMTLSDIPVGDRLAELDFELPLAGGDTPSGNACTLDQVAALINRHVPSDDPFASYGARLIAAGLGQGLLRGYLTGSLDAVLRVRAADGSPRYLVVDYKTNRLAPVDEQLTTWHYRPQVMAEAMMAAHYPLQLLLYSVALHRFLRWRQPGYDPDQQLGGALYLFVRGMCGPRTPVVDGTPCGVLSWRPPTALVVELSSLLDGGAR
ncbi:UvrD-helicase domain-containing protein [Angustibacter sp. McL0619]|uniref:UvrD-helicase domain-containing protein n=1 Tax=Angustibacter sp. McL0619 TaxID=3415676 RepID=UPI003CFA8931